jgi:hypothetical protein
MKSFFIKRASFFKGLTMGNRSLPAPGDTGFPRQAAVPAAVDAGRCRSDKSVGKSGELW